MRQSVSSEFAVAAVISAQGFAWHQLDTPTIVQLLMNRRFA
jgi:hypothetical protein